MYDRTWARSVYTGYAKLCTRAQQIDLCILQTIAAQTGRNYTRASLVTVLIDSIQGKEFKQLWPLYKRLVKRTPLDKDLLEIISTRLKPYLGDPVNQLSFDFEVDVVK